MAAGNGKNITIINASDRKFLVRVSSQKCQLKDYEYKQAREKSQSNSFGVGFDKFSLNHSNSTSDKQSSSTRYQLAWSQFINDGYVQVHKGYPKKIWSETPTCYISVAVLNGTPCYINNWSTHGSEFTFNGQDLVESKVKATAKWVENGNIPTGFAMLKGGYGSDKSARYIGRIRVGNSMAVGKVVYGKGIWYPYGGKEYKATKGYQVLVTNQPDAFEWVWRSASGSFPKARAVKGGWAEKGAQGYIGRIPMNNDLVIGKAYTYKVYLPYAGKEHVKSQYYVLCYKQ